MVTSLILKNGYGTGYRYKGNNSELISRDLQLSFRVCFHLPWDVVYDPLGLSFFICKMRTPVQCKFTLFLVVSRKNLVSGVEIGRNERMGKVNSNKMVIENSD